VTLAEGQSFFTPETEGVRRHLWVIVSDPTRTKQLVIVNLSTKPPATAESADPPRVDAGEHPAISQDSIVRCEEARIVSTADLERLIVARTLSPTKPATPSLVRKLGTVLRASTVTPLNVKRLLEDQHGGPAGELKA